MKKICCQGKQNLTFGYGNDQVILGALCPVQEVGTAILRGCPHYDSSLLHIRGDCRENQEQIQQNEVHCLV